MDELENEGEITMDSLGYQGEGKFVSPLLEYPGSITLAFPFYGRNYKAWLKATREEFEDEIEKLTVFAEWRGFVSIMADWSIEAVTPNDVTPDGDNVPERLKFWCRTCMVEYLAAQYDPKALQGLQETS